MVPGRHDGRLRGHAPRFPQPGSAEKPSYRASLILGGDAERFPGGKARALRPDPLWVMWRAPGRSHGPGSPDGPNKRSSSPAEPEPPSVVTQPSGRIRGSHNGTFSHTGSMFGQTSVAVLPLCPCLRHHLQCSPASIPVYMTVCGNMRNLFEKWPASGRRPWSPFPLVSGNDAQHRPLRRPEALGGRLNLVILAAAGCRRRCMPALWNSAWM